MLKLERSLPQIEIHAATRSETRCPARTARYHSTGEPGPKAGEKKQQQQQVWDPEVSIRIYLCSYRLCLLAVAECVSFQLMAATISVRL